MADELISRQALAEEIESLTVTVAGKPARWYDAKHSVIRIIAEQPAVDAVEVSSCDGCIYSHRKRPQKCSCCRRNRDLKDCYERREENAAD